MTSDSDPIFQIRRLQKSFAAFRLEISDFTVFRNEVLSLVGPTGSGKSTLLRLIAGAETVDAGDVLFDGCSMAMSSRDLETRRRITMVYQRPILLTGSVRFNIEYGLRRRGEKKIDQTVDAIMNQLGLIRLQQQSTSTLSGGQTQLVAIARSLVLKPEVLLLDEPTSHLDPAHVELVEKTIRGLRAEIPMTVVWATHNLFQARRVGNRAAFVLNGNIVEANATDEFFSHPTDSRTADFIEGRMIY